MDKLLSVQMDHTNLMQLILFLYEPQLAQHPNKWAWVLHPRDVQCLLHDLIGCWGFWLRDLL